MTDLHFGGVLLVAAVAFASPFLLGLAPRLRLPSVVLEIVAGIVIGPAVLGWVSIDPPLQVLSLIGPAFLLFLAGYPVAQVFAPRDHAVICFEPMTAPTNALVSGRGLRFAPPAGAFHAAFEISVASSRE